MFKRYAKIKFTQNKLSLFQDFQLQTIVHSTLIECAFFYYRVYFFLAPSFAPFFSGAVVGFAREIFFLSRKQRIAKILDIQIEFI